MQFEVLISNRAALQIRFYVCWTQFSVALVGVKVRLVSSAAFSLKILGSQNRALSALKLR